MTLKYAATTLLLLALVAAFSLAWAALRFKWTGARRRQPFGMPLFLPGVLLAPLMIALGFRVLGLNLIFPPALVATAGEWTLHAVAPALALFFASGLAASIAAEVTGWKQAALQKAFHRTRLAFGLDPERTLRRLVLTAALTRSWERALPWLFSELIVLECLFNAPGLGWDIWQRAKERRLGDLTEAVVILLCLYGICRALAARFSRRLGQRLEGYV